ncbi:MAG: hypothetical protein F2842_07725 [Actinobacteria bacterium]|uniref:Unannotated protein n=1 Tax=freshwater metagenome TaxID=449393 RepID=A0A6J7KD70_9ZZZZ|nr:hypothetical protein [Actinomycetota bacterium]
MDMSTQDPFFVAGFDVTADADTEFNEWYDSVHIPDALGIGGFRSVTRLVRAGEYDNTFGPKYLNLYQVSSQSDFEAGWDTDYRRASSADFNRWGPSLRNGHVGLYVPFER